ncbi:hypothetical protein V8G54_004671 [Vigna mungo]|uniref:Uncharacterized protein n=1 Tax=Vigna mungo TaxID=3915 RepID=A0AAQ3PE93_VIGMU
MSDASSEKAQFRTQMVLKGAPARRSYSEGDNSSQEKQDIHPSPFLVKSFQKAKMECRKKFEGCRKKYPKKESQPKIDSDTAKLKSLSPSMPYFYFNAVEPKFSNGVLLQVPLYVSSLSFPVEEASIPSQQHHQDFLSQSSNPHSVSFFWRAKGYCSASTDSPEAVPATSPKLVPEAAFGTGQALRSGSAAKAERVTKADPLNSRVMIIDGTSIIHRAYYKLLGKFPSLCSFLLAHNCTVH